MNVTNILGLSITNILSKRKINKKTLAEAIGKSPYWVGQICSGRMEPSTKLAESIAAELDCCYVNIRVVIPAEKCDKAQKEINNVIKKYVG